VGFLLPAIGGKCHFMVLVSFFITPYSGKVKCNAIFLRAMRAEGAKIEA
jgi:hypothetical protein